VKLATRTEVEIEHVQRLAKKYTGKAPGRGAADVWLARLQLMRTMGLDDKEVWLEAKGCIQGESEAEMKVWMWGLENQEDRVVWKVKVNPYPFIVSLTVCNLTGSSERKHVHGTRKGT
jgi:hypothetical protein